MVLVVLYYVCIILSKFNFNSDDLYRYSIVEGDHFLWKDVSKPYRETIRAFLVYFQNQVTSTNRLGLFFAHILCNFLNACFFIYILIIFFEMMFLQL